MSKIIEVRTDLPSLNPHDHLDFQIHFKPYLEFIFVHYNGYISQVNFFQFMKNGFGKTESQTKTILKKLIENNWIGQEKVGNRHKILFLKRKSRVCLEKKKLSDLPSPTNRTIIRSLLVEHFTIEKGTSYYERNVYAIKKGFEPNDVLFAVWRSGKIEILFLDIVRKTANQYVEFIRSFLIDERFDGKEVFIRFLTYTEDRKKTLSKVLKDEAIQNIKSTIIKPERLKLAVTCYDLIPYFDNKEPLI